MNWYYASKNERSGPVDAAALLALLDNRTIDATTLVWREGMAEWMPFASVQAEFSAGKMPVAATAIPSPTVGASAPRCVECGLLFPRTQVIELDGQCVCAACKPIYLQKLREGVPVGGGAGVWRKKRDLVVALQAPLPDRCVKCNSSIQGHQRLKRDLYWHHPALYIMIFFPGLLFYALVAVLVRKRAKLEVGLCDLHRSKRSRAMLIAWLIFFVGIGAFFLAAAMQGDLAPVAIVTGIVLVLAALIGGVVSTRMVFARKIDKTHAFVGGVCREYLEQLPEWQGS
ncbi:MAG: DUF4339 domain-containing protein [Chthoniobacteraceae bacterium]